MALDGASSWTLARADKRGASRDRSSHSVEREEDDRAEPTDTRRDRSRRTRSVRGAFTALLDAQDDITVVGEAGDGDEAFALTSGSAPMSS